MPAMSLSEASDYLQRTDPLFATGNADIGGETLRVFTNIPDNLRELQQRGQALRSDEDYLIYQQQRWSYSHFCNLSQRVSAVLLTELAVRPGDRIAIAMRNYPEYLVLLMAIANIGCVAVLFNAWWTTEELRFGFEHSDAKRVFADPPRRQRIQPFASALGVRVIGVRGDDGDAAGDTAGDTLESLLAGVAQAHWPQIPIAPDDDFAVMYSSGSTGHPKGVVLTHRRALSAVYSWLMSARLGPLMAPDEQPPPAPGPPCFLCATPLFHVTATHPAFLLSIPMGARFVMMHKWDPLTALQLMRDEKVTRFVGVPTMSADLAEQARQRIIDVPSLEYLGSGGAKRPAAQVLDQATVFSGAALGSGWGMTETNALGIGISGPDYLDKPEFAGRLLPPLQQLRIVDDNNQQLASGCIGELTIKSAALMRGYLNDPTATANTIRNGWLHTGDLATINDDGYVTIVGRKKEIIIRAGENISCLEVEGAIHQHPAVAEACVFSIPDQRLGETVGAAIVRRDRQPLTDATLQHFLSERLANFKIPARLWWLDSALPRGATDKIDRRRLRANCLQSHTLNSPTDA